LSFITDEQLVSWDFAEGKSIAKLNIKEEKLSAINIKKIRDKFNNYSLFVQGKCGTVLLVKCFIQDQRYKL
jgi:hypothetical protein